MHLPKLHWILIPAILMGSFNVVHGLYHIDEAQNDWHHTTYMSWATPCLGIGQIECHTVVVLIGEFALPIWLGFWLLVYAGAILRQARKGRL